MNHFIVKHDLESFNLLPGYIWRTGSPSTEVPHRFGEVQQGDRWIEYAYIEDEFGSKPCSRICGFYECVKTCWFGDVPLDEATLKTLDGWNFFAKGKAWMIQGVACQDQPDKPVETLSIDELLGKPHFRNQAIVPISSDDFERIQKATVATTN